MPDYTEPRKAIFSFAFSAIFALIVDVADN